MRRLNPLDEVARRLMAPVLAEFGFRRRGRRFLLEQPSGAWAEVQPRPFKLGINEAEFFVDIEVEPGIYERFLNRYGDRDSYCGGMWNGRLNRPDPPTALHGQWSFDLGDADSESEFTETLRNFVPMFLPLLDAEHMLAHIRDPIPGLSPVSVRRDLAIALLLAEAGPSEELEQRLSELERVDPSDEWAPSNHEAAAFIRERLEGV